MRTLKRPVRLWHVVLGGLIAAVIAAGGAALANNEPSGFIGKTKYASTFVTYHQNASDSGKVSCGSRYKVMGGGFTLLGHNNRNFAVVQSSPYDGADADTVRDDGWQVVIDNGTGSDLGTDIHAICQHV